MNYRETIDFLFSSLPMYQRTGKAAYKANLDNTHALDRVLRHPHRNFKTIHIAGTNGKGSVSHMLASIFQEAGYKTGLYTSPHLLDFRERIRINGKMIGEQQVIDFVKTIKDEIIKIEPSFFEMTVAMAFHHFSQEKVEIAIIETGMGGRLDSTNIITPEASVITSISTDHTEFLGETEVLIAGEKAGIIKKGVPCVSGNNSQEVREVIAEAALQNKSQMVFADQIRRFSHQAFLDDSTSLFHFHTIEGNQEEVIKTDLNGSYQSENLNIVLATTDLMRRGSWELTDSAIFSGLTRVKKNTGLLGRWDILGSNPTVICDTAHNEAGIRVVIDQLMQIPAGKLHIVWGMVGDKDTKKILPLLPSSALFYFTQPSIPRAMAVEKLEREALHSGLKGRSWHLVEDAYRAALKNAAPEDLLFVGGSTFVVADLLLFLKGESHH